MSLEQKLEEENKDLKDKIKEFSHDFNNLLVTAMLQIECIEQTQEEQSTKNEYDDGIKKVKRVLITAIEQLREYTSSVLTRKSEEEEKYTYKVVNVCRGTAKLFRSSYDKQGVEINERYIDAKQTMITSEISKQELQRVYLNLIINAQQAIKGKGSISLEVLTNDRYVVTEIIDTGCGISQQEKEDIFKKGYTTKDEGKGIGLAICKELIEKCRGKIEVESEVNKGTKFKVYMPIS